MRRFLLGLLLMLGLAAQAQAQDSAPPSDLREYFLVLLVNPGAERVPMPSEVFAQHMAYMNAQYAAGVYKIGGPITDGERIRGMMIMQAETLEAANGIVARDPSVVAGILAPEIHPMMARDLSALDAGNATLTGPAPPPDVREYFLVMLVNPGAERIPMPDDVFAAHMAYRNARVAAGAIKAGGPVTDGGRIRGVSIVEAESLEAARAAALQDPAVLADILAVEAHPMMARDLSALSAAQ